MGSQLGFSYFIDIRGWFWLHYDLGFFQVILFSVVVYDHQDQSYNKKIRLFPTEPNCPLDSFELAESEEDEFLKEGIYSLIDVERLDLRSFFWWLWVEFEEGECHLDEEGDEGEEEKVSECVFEEVNHRLYKN